MLDTGPQNIRTPRGSGLEEPSAYRVAEPFDSSDRVTNAHHGPRMAILNEGPYPVNGMVILL
ncbi:hypothetical protein [Pasteuria penetrans]|uniref:hypothetical protein n=1 Tax=Pasteuria penetrans TaxID=86005 RepID=UPI000FC1BCDB|nr:hypothetical protein [Pasteuria penetrans]